MKQENETGNVTLEFNKDKMVVVALAALFVVAAVQSVILAGSLNVLKEQTTTPIISGNTTAVSQSVANSGPTPSIPENLQNLPSQVGGC